MIIGSLLIVLAAAGAGLGFSSLGYAVLLVGAGLLLDLLRRSSPTVRLVDIWRAAFAYLFGSEAAFVLPHVRADFSPEIVSTAEGLIVAAFGASLLGYGVAQCLQQEGRIPRSPGVLSVKQVSIAAAILTSAVVLLLLFFLSPTGLVTGRSLRGGERPLGAWSSGIVAAMVVQGIVTAQLVRLEGRITARSAPFVGVAMASCVILYLLGTRYFLGFLIGGALFYVTNFSRAMSRRHLFLCLSALLAIAVVQGSMRVARQLGTAPSEGRTLIGALGDARTYMSQEGILRVHAWLHAREVLETAGRPFEHAFLFYWWIPRSVWSTKPTMDGYWLAREVMADADVATGHSVAGGFALAALLDGGRYLGIGLCFLYGLALCRLDRFVVRHASAGDPRSVFAALLPFGVFFAVRSPQTSLIFLQQCMVAYAPLFALLRWRQGARVLGRKRATPLPASGSTARLQGPEPREFAWPRGRSKPAAGGCDVHDRRRTGVRRKMPMWPGARPAARAAVVVGRGS